jgi:hypothetical protein
VTLVPALASLLLGVAYLIWSRGNLDAVLERLWRFVKDVWRWLKRG